MLRRPIRAIFSNRSHARHSAPTPDLMRAAASPVLGRLQRQDPIWLPVAVISRSREVLSAGVAKR